MGETETASDLPSSSAPAVFDAVVTGFSDFSRRVNSKQGIGEAPPSESSLVNLNGESTPIARFLSLVFLGEAVREPRDNLKFFLTPPPKEHNNRIKGELERLHIKMTDVGH